MQNIRISEIIQVETYDDAPAWLIGLRKLWLDLRSPLGRAALSYLLAFAFAEVMAHLISAPVGMAMFVAILVVLLPHGLLAGRGLPQVFLLVLAFFPLFRLVSLGLLSEVEIPSKKMVMLAPAPATVFQPPNGVIGTLAPAVNSPMLVPTPIPSILPTATLFQNPSASSTIFCGQPPSGWVPYAARPGDSIILLSSFLEIESAELRQANCLGISEDLSPGRKIYVPGRVLALLGIDSTITSTYMPTATVSSKDRSDKPALPTQTPDPTDKPATANKPGTRATPTAAPLDPPTEPPAPTSAPMPTEMPGPTSAAPPPLDPPATQAPTPDINGIPTQAPTPGG